MAPYLFLALCTAVLSSVMTLALVWLYFERVLRPRLEEQIRRAEEEVERRVRSGAIAAGQELMPALRAEVAGGFRDAVRESSAAELVEGGAKVVTKSAGLIGEGLNTLLGLKPGR